MKQVWMLLLLAVAPAALANSVTICKHDTMMVSSNSISILSPSHRSVRLNIDCQLALTPQSKVLVQVRGNRGRTIAEDRLITVVVDQQKNHCRVQSIATIT